jgi:hypothetical protein
VTYARGIEATLFAAKSQPTAPPPRSTTSLAASGEPAAKAT